MLKKCSFPSPALFLALFFTAAALLPCSALAMPEARTTQNIMTGEITETMNSGGYTYMLLKSPSGEENWVAIPERVVERGATVRYHEGMAMKNFTSKTLNKTFETIIFSPGLADAAAQSPVATSQSADSFSAAVEAEKRADNARMPSREGLHSGGSLAAIVPFEELHLEKIAAPDGYTVAELFGKGKELDGKQVALRGKVVKFSAMIMGRNWVHIQDGTGNPMKNEHDLVATTQDTAREGTVVVVKGVLAANKDFGAGYRYDIIVEDAKIQQE